MDVSILNDLWVIEAVASALGFMALALLLFRNFRHVPYFPLLAGLFLVVAWEVSWASVAAHYFTPPQLPHPNIVSRLVGRSPEVIYVWVVVFVFAGVGSKRTSAKQEGRDEGN